MRKLLEKAKVDEEFVLNNKNLSHYKSLSMQVTILLGFLWCSVRGETHPVRFEFDFTNFKLENPLVEEFVSKVALPKAAARIQSWLNVTDPDPQVIPPLGSDFDCGVDFDKGKRATSSTEADLLIFLVSSQSDKINGWFSLSKPCVGNEADGRPRVGVIFISENSFNVSMSFLNKEVSILIHNLLSLLLFSKEIIFRSPRGESHIAKKIQEGNNTLIKFSGPSLIDYGKIHFNCFEFNGILSENADNQDLSEVNFEKLMVGDEITTSNFTFRALTSRITMAVFNDSGWYQVNSAKSEINMWGRNEGCDFLKMNCKSRFHDFCSDPGQTFCSEDLRSKVACSNSSFSGVCKIPVSFFQHHCAYSNWFLRNFKEETAGPYSRCFLVTANSQPSSGCFTSYCSNDRQKLFVVTSKGTFVCEEGLQIELEGNLIIKCPNPNTFCFVSDMNRCANDCNARGKCLKDNSCDCDLGFSGNQCEFLEPMGISNALDQILEAFENSKNTFNVSSLQDKCNIFGILVILTILSVLL